MSLFTQKHYEHLEAALWRQRAIYDPSAMALVVEVLSNVLARDNPKFKRDLFRARALEDYQQEEKTDAIS